jgi:hypothetical protein
MSEVLLGIIVPANLSCDEWGQAYASIFKGANGWRIGISAKRIKDKVEKGA